VGKIEVRKISKSKGIGKLVRSRSKGGTRVSYLVSRVKSCQAASCCHVTDSGRARHLHALHAVAKQARKHGLIHILRTHHAFFPFYCPLPNPLS
jgi:hypothetical protein